MIPPFNSVHDSILASKLNKRRDFNSTPQCRPWASPAVSLPVSALLPGAIISLLSTFSCILSVLFTSMSYKCILNVKLRVFNPKFHERKHAISELFCLTSRPILRKKSNQILVPCKGPHLYHIDEAEAQHLIGRGHLMF